MLNIQVTAIHTLIMDVGYVMSIVWQSVVKNHVQERQQDMVWTMQYTINHFLLTRQSIATLETVSGSG